MTTLGSSMINPGDPAARKKNRCLQLRRAEKGSAAAQAKAATLVPL